MTHRRDETTDAGHEPRRFTVALAEDESTILAAQRLRYRVFNDDAAPGVDHEAEGLDPSNHDVASDHVDRDRFDAHCEHLVVRDTDSGDVVGTYRILTAERARAAGGFYSETEFDVTRLRGLNARLVEVGRACVDPAYRGGGVIMKLLAGLTRYVVAHDYDYVMGCASLDARRDPEAAGRLCRRLVTEHLGPERWRVAPHVPFRMGAETDDGDLPPLIKAYLRFGATICGAPAWDAAFGTADLLMLLPMAAMTPRFRARLLRDDPDPAPSRSGGRRRTRWAA